jgi:hypothetical protein
VKGRRLLTIAVTNCEAEQSLISGGATANNIPVAGLANFFLTEPVTTSGRNVVGEMIGFAGTSGGAVDVKP